MVEKESHVDPSMRGRGREVMVEVEVKGVAEKEEEDEEEERVRPAMKAIGENDDVEGIAGHDVRVELL